MNRFPPPVRGGSVGGGGSLSVHRSVKKQPTDLEGKGLTCIWWLLKTATFEIIWGSKGNDLYVAEMTPKVFPLPHRDGV